MPEAHEAPKAPEAPEAPEVPGTVQPVCAQTLLAFDFGVRRVGVALGNTVSGSARALDTIDAPDADRRFARIEALLRTWQPEALVVGLPLNEDGTPGERTRLAERFANRLRGRFGLPVHLVDERYSSREAQSMLTHAGPGRPRRRVPAAALANPEDALAAEIILRQYLEASALPTPVPAPAFLPDASASAS